MIVLVCLVFDEGSRGVDDILNPQEEEEETLRKKRQVRQC